MPRIITKGDNLNELNKNYVQQRLLEPIFLNNVPKRGTHLVRKLNHCIGRCCTLTVTTLLRTTCRDFCVCNYNASMKLSNNSKTRVSDGL